MLSIHFACSRQHEQEGAKDNIEGDHLHRSKQERMSGQERVMGVEVYTWGEQAMTDVLGANDCEDSEFTNQEK